MKNLIVRGWVIEEEKSISDFLSEVALSVQDVELKRGQVVTLALEVTENGEKTNDEEKQIKRSSDYKQPQFPNFSDL